jgi:hypothetical protein
MQQWKKVDAKKSTAVREVGVQLTLPYDEISVDRLLRLALAMADLGSHAALLAAQFPPAFACFLDTHVALL